MGFLEELRWRGLVEDVTPALEQELCDHSLSAYIGFDPSSHSLHVGSLLPILALARLQRAGHTPIAIVGGGTGLIGDPSGKNVERNLLTPEEVESNLAGIREQLSRFLGFEPGQNAAQIINNADWLSSMDVLEFLRDVGKHFTVNGMISRESVRRRLAREDGISFTEFSYMLLQALDYLVLYDRYDCRLQMGGTDQWGNILAGIDLIRRTRSGKAHGLVFPLIANSSGTKFGKTEMGTVWLDPELTSPYEFHQFWLNTRDNDVVRYLKYFTFLGETTIEEIEAEFAKAPEERAAQKALADEVTQLVHGRDALKSARQAAAALFAEGNASSQQVLASMHDAPTTEVSLSSLSVGRRLSEMLMSTDLASSKSDATRLIDGGGVYLNNIRVLEDRLVTVDDAVDRKVLWLRRGKKRHHLVKLV